VYEQFRAGISERIPELTFEGVNFDPVIWRVLLAKALSYLKLVAIVLVASGYNPFLALGMDTPQFYEWAVSNKIYACLMSWFLTGMFENSLMSTGAFEVYYNDLQIWSKLESGRLPEFVELLTIVAQQRDQAFRP